MPIDAQCELIGPAARVFRQLQKKLLKYQSGCSKANDPILLHGAPGTGKSTIATQLANSLVGHPSSIESLNGQQLTVDLVKEWRRSAQYRNINDWCTVKLVDEIDKGSAAALGDLRTYLDYLKPWIVFLATTNRKPSELDDSLQSRFYDMEVSLAKNAEIVESLGLVGIPGDVAIQIANIAKGNVRQAQIDARKWLDWKEAA